MGTPLKVQRRGKGSSTYRAPSHRYKGQVRHRKFDDAEKNGDIRGKIIDIIHDPGRSAPIARVR